MTNVSAGENLPQLLICSCFLYRARYCDPTNEVSHPRSRFKFAVACKQISDKTNLDGRQELSASGIKDVHLPFFRRTCHSFVRYRNHVCYTAYVDPTLDALGQLHICRVHVPVIIKTPPFTARRQLHDANKT